MKPKIFVLNDDGVDYRKLLMLSMAHDLSQGPNDFNVNEEFLYNVRLSQSECDLLKNIRKEFDERKKGQIK